MSKAVWKWGPWLLGAVIPAILLFWWRGYLGSGPSVPGLQGGGGKKPAAALEGKAGKGAKPKEARRRALLQGEEADSLVSCLTLDPSYAMIPAKRYYRLRVLYRDSKRPVPGASVSWMPSGFPLGGSPLGQFLSSQLLDGYTLFEFVQQKGVKTKTDRKGIARIPFCPWGTYVSTRKGDFIGIHFMGRPYPPSIEEGKRIETKVYLDKTISFPVKVIGPAGQALPGVPLRALFIQDYGATSVAWTGRTGKNGIVWPQIMKSFLLGPFSRTIKMEFWGPLPRGKPVEVSLDPPPDTPVTLRLERFAKITVLFLDRAGRPWKEKGMVRLRAKECVEHGDWLNSLTLLSGGRAVFPYVGLGFHWWISLVPLKGKVDYRKPLWFGEGPKSPGENFLVRIRVPKEREKKLYLLVKGEDGKPLPNALLLLENFVETSGLDANFGRWGRDTIGTGTTDEKGYLEVPPRVRKNGWYRLTLWEETTPRGKPRGPYAIFSFPPGAGTPGPRGGILLGQVSLSRGAPAVMGKVVGRDGKGIPGVLLEFSSLQEKAGEPGAPPGDQCDLLTGKNGEFKLFGNFQGKPITVYGFKRGYRQILGERIEPGNFHVRLEMERERWIRGIFVVDSLETARHLRAVFEKEKGPSRYQPGSRYRGIVRRAPKQGPGEWFSFGLGKAQPGDWSAWISWEGYKLWEKQFSVPQQEGGGYRFAQPVDLRGRFRTWRFHVLDREGKPVPGKVSLLVAGPGGKTFEEDQPLLGKGGARVFPVPREFPVLALRAEGYLPVDVRGLSGTGETVRMDKGVPVVLEARIPPSLLAKRRFGSVGFKLEIFREPEKGEAWTEWQKKVGARPVATLLLIGAFRKKKTRLPGYGTYIARWSACKPAYFFWTKGVPVEAPPIPFVLKKGKENRVVLTLAEGPAEKAVSRLLDE